MEHKELDIRVTKQRQSALSSNIQFQHPISSKREYFTALALITELQALIDEEEREIAAYFRRN